MNRELDVLRVFLVLLALILNGCQTTVTEPMTGLANPTTVSTAVVIPTEVEPAAAPATETISTAVPVSTLTREAADPYPGWERYMNEAYQFGFRYPPKWTLEEEPNLLRFSQGTLLFAVSFQRQGESVPSPWTGMPAGESESRGTILFLGREINKNALVFEGRVKALTYGATVDDLAFSIRLDDMAATDYRDIQISEVIQGEIDQIVGSFERG